MPTRSALLDERAIGRALNRMASEIVEKCHGTEDLLLVGIQRRGVHLAERLASLIGQWEQATIPCGKLDITLYRDDLQAVGPRPVVGETSLPGDLDGKTVVIVDDVLYTGRTVRAALDELADFGRPAPDRCSACWWTAGGRELPIQPTSSASGSAPGPATGWTCWSCRARRPRRRGTGRGAPDGRGTSPLGKDLLGLEDLSADQIRLILDTAEPFKEISERAIKKVPALRGKTIVNLFFEASTRTRISFEFAEKRLSADTVNVAASGIVGQRRARRWWTPRGTSRRCASTWWSSATARPARRSSSPTASSRTSSTPATASTSTRRRGCSTCSRCATIRPDRGPQGRICGDVLHSRVARSNIWGLHEARRGGRRCAGRQTLLPHGIEELGVTVLPPHRGGDRVGRRAQRAAAPARADDRRATFPRCASTTASSASRGSGSRAPRRTCSSCTRGR